MKYKGYINEGNVSFDSGRALEYSAVMRLAMSDQNYTLSESSLRLPFDEDLFRRTQDLAERLVNQNLSYVLNIGIGGSSLGAKAVYDAVMGVFDAHTPLAPKMLFAETCSPELLSSIIEIVSCEVFNKEELIIVVTSKSGTTTETIVNASILISALEQKLGSLADRIVCISDEGSSLWQTAEKYNYHLLPIPSKVGGRFSVFSPAGMFPLLCIGVDGEALLRGAQTAVYNVVERGVDGDAFRFACDMLSWHENGVSVIDFFAFHPELESVGKWYRQLIAESIGKQETLDGIKTTYRIVPTVSLGSTDLHSIEQMHLANPNIMARILVRAHTLQWEHQFIARDLVFAPLVSGVTGKSPSDILDAIYQGVIDTYKEQKVSFGELSLSDLKEESLGELLQFFMCATMHLGRLLNIDTFNQPNVELYKKATRNILEGKRK